MYKELGGGLVSEQSSYKLKFVDRILDPVHGFIDITEVEQKIIELPIYKRLESIKQLSLTNWIFPGAEHTRYIHSLGVMHICDQMAKNLKRLDGSLRFKDEQRQMLRLAGLLHDIGHYPLSHVTEDVYIHEHYLEKRPDSILSGYHSDVLKEIDNLPQKPTPEYMKSRYTKEMHHEKMGTEIILSDSQIKSIISEFCPFISINKICDIIVGCVDNIIDIDTGEIDQDLSIMVQLLHSELDADGIDYVLRDASFSGTSYGAFELGLLLRNLVVGTYSGVEIVGIKPKGISVADQYLISKYFSYTQVIFNRHVSILEVMVHLFSQYLIRRGREGGYYSPDDLLRAVRKHEKEEDYLRFTDRKFWMYLDQNDIEQVKSDSPTMGDIFYRLAKYQELEMLPQGEMVWTNDNPQEVYQEIINSEMYKTLQSDPESQLFVFLQKGFTSEIKENDFRNELININGGEHDDRFFIRENTRRLQEGIVVFENEKEPKLLIDDPRSVIGYLHSAKTYIFRGYQIC